MPWRIGFDLESPSRIAEALAVHGDRYLRSVYTGAEIERCRQARAPGRASDVDPRLLAGRYAAKEAAFKAIGIGCAAVSWRDVEVVSQRTGDPCLRLHGAATTLAQAGGIGMLSLALSYERGVAAAIVIAVCFR